MAEGNSHSFFRRDDDYDPARYAAPLKPGEAVAFIRNARRATASMRTEENEIEGALAAKRNHKGRARHPMRPTGMGFGYPEMFDEAAA